MSLSESDWSGPWCSDTKVCFVGEDRSSVLCIKDAGRSGEGGWAGGGTGDTTSRGKKWAFRRVSRVQHLQKKTRNNPGERQQIQKNDALHHQSWQKHAESLLASTTNHPSLLELSRKDARVDLYGSNLRGTRSFSTTDSAHTTAPTAQHCGKKKRSREALLQSGFYMEKKGEERKKRKCGNIQT